MDPATIVGIVIAFVAILVADDPRGRQPDGPAAPSRHACSSSAARSAPPWPAARCKRHQRSSTTSVQRRAPREGARPRTPPSRPSSSWPSAPAARACSRSRTPPRTSTTRSCATGLAARHRRHRPRGARARSSRPRSQAKRARDKRRAKVFTDMGGYAPTDRHHRHRHRAWCTCWRTSSSPTTLGPPHRRRLHRDAVGRAVRQRDVAADRASAQADHRARERADGGRPRGHPRRSRPGRTPASSPQKLEALLPPGSAKAETEGGLSPRAARGGHRSHAAESTRRST